MAQLGAYSVNSNMSVPSLPSQAACLTAEATLLQQVSRYCRRPLVDIFVMIGPNCIPSSPLFKAMLNGAAAIAELLHAGGVDTRTVTHRLERKPLNEPPQFSQALAEKIQASTADFYVVLTKHPHRPKELNLQMPRRNRLAGTTPEAFLLIVRKTWPQEPTKNYARIETLSPAHLQVFSQRYTGVAQVHTRLQNVLCGNAEVGAEAVVLHREATLAYCHLLKPHVESGVEILEGDSEMTRGRVRAADYNPNHPTHTPCNSIRPELRYRLAEFLGHTMRAMEARFAHRVFSPAWTHYYNSKVLWSSLPQLPPKPACAAPWQHKEDEEENDAEKRLPVPLNPPLVYFANRMAFFVEAMKATRAVEAVWSAEEGQRRASLMPLYALF